MAKKIITALSGVLFIIISINGCAHFTKSYRQATLEDMHPILSEQEYDQLKSLNTDEEIRNYVNEYWQKIDPTPNSPKNELREEFERRLKYANKHFPDRRGWGFSDRKRIYLIYGPPTFIDREDFSSEQLGTFQKIKASEVWVYMTPGKSQLFPTKGDDLYPGQKKFIFADLVGSGVFKMIDNSEIGGEVDTRMYK